MRDTDLVDRIVSYNPKVDTRIIKKAFHFGMLMHGSQLRESGDPYFSHPIEVANILAELNLTTHIFVVKFQSASSTPSICRAFSILFSQVEQLPLTKIFISFDCAL